ncbi:LysR family transcriptional regulator [uncultured Cohaesibacter sp.]|uniref:LysR family transcriptional regulator n=1 Tax=uncultured Cohaesibacter sp. TaxID=1002546 RepID=UPI00292E114D|nr:LysR family transcriptional regulator [uncultured Cohaesibacter sp.]
MPSLRSLHAFEGVCQFGSVTKASIQIHLSQPALTQSLGKLENELGVGLFLRKKGMVPTEAGEVLFRRVASGMSHLKLAVWQCAEQKVKANPNLYRQISSSQLDCFHAAVEEGSFKGASQSLDLSLATVQRAFRSLEALLGIDLAETRPGNVRRNSEGERFYTLTKLALREFRQAFHDLNGWKGHYEESFTVGALPLVQSSILPEAVLAFSQEFPHVTVVVVDGIYSSMSNQMRRGEIDYIIGALRRDERAEDFEQVPLFDDSLIILAREGHPLTRLQQVNKLDLAAYPWIMPRKGSPSRLYFDQFYKSLDRPANLQCPIETGSFSVLRGMLQKSDRLGTVSKLQAQYELNSRQLARIDYPLSHSARSIGYAQRKGWHPSLPQQRFLQLLGTISHSQS